MKKSNLLRPLYISIFMILFTTPAMAADLIGDTIAGQLDWNNLGHNGFNANIHDSTPTIATVVDPGVEFSYPTTNVTYSADFNANTLTIAYTSHLNKPNQVTRLNFHFTDLNYGADIVGVEIISNDFKQKNVLNISFGPNSIHVDMPPMNIRKIFTAELKLLIVTSPSANCDLIDPATVFERLSQITDPEYICYSDGTEYFQYISHTAVDGSVETEIGLEDQFDGTWYGYVFEYKPETPGALIERYRYDLTLDQVQECRAAFEQTFSPCQ